MATAEELVLLDKVLRMAYSVRIYLYFINKEHWFPVRKILFQFILVHRLRFKESYCTYFLNATQPLWPPKPSESDRAMVRSAVTGLFGV